MFKNEFQKEIARIEPDQRTINRAKSAVRADIAPRTRERKRLSWRPAIALATAVAAFAVFVFGGLPFLGGESGNGGLPGLNGSNNSFTLRAYAMTEQEDGTLAQGAEWGITDGRIAVEFDDRLEVAHLGVQGVFSSPEVMGGDLLGLIISTGLGFRLDGENIVSARLTADQGFFQVIRTDNQTYWYIDRVDGTFDLNDANLSSMLIWGYEYRYPAPIPETIRDGATTRAVTERNEPATAQDRVTATANKLPETVMFTAIVTFEDGEEQVELITFNPRDVWEAVYIQIQNLPPPTQNPDGTWG